MYTLVQKWGNSHAVRLPKTLLDELDICENDRVEITHSHNAITIRKASPRTHRTLEERLTTFYGRPVEQLERLPDTAEVDWGGPIGTEL